MAEAEATIRVDILGTSAQQATSNKPALPSGVIKPISVGKALLKLGLDGKVKVGGGLAFSASIFSSSFNSQLAGTADIAIYFLDSADARIGRSVSGRARSAFQNIDDGFTSLSGLDDMFRKEELYAMHIKATSALTFGASIGFAKSFADGEHIKVKFGHEVKRDFSEQGEFDYLVSNYMVGGEHVIAVQITRKASATDTTTSRFGLDIDPSGLFKHYQPLIEEHLGEARAVIDKYNEMLPGSDYLLTQLKDTVSEKISDQATKDLIDSVIDGDGNRQSSEVLVDILVGRVEETVDGWAEDAEDGASKLTAKMIDELRPVYPDVDKLKDKINEAAEAAIQRKANMLKELTKEKFPGNEVDELLAMLEKAGESVSGQLSNLDDKIEAASQKVAVVFSKLTKVIDRIEQYTQIATEKGIELALNKRTSSTESDALDLRFDIYPERDPAQANKIFHTILKGDIKSVIERIIEVDAINEINVQQGAEELRPVVKGIGGMYQRYLSLTQENGADLVLWDINLGKTSIIDATVDWVQNLDGSVSVATKSYFSETRYRGDETRTVTFTTSAEMLFASKQDTVNMGLTVSYEDEELHANEVHKFLNGMLQRGMLSQDVISKAIGIIDATPSDVLNKAKLDVGLSLSRAQLDKLLEHVGNTRTVEPCSDACHIPRMCTSNHSDSQCLHVVETATRIMASVARKHHRDQIFIDGAVSVTAFTELGSTLREGMLGMTESAYNDAERQVSDEIYPQGILGEDDYEDTITYLQYRHYGAAALYEILAHVKELTLSGDKIKTLSAGIVQDLNGWTPEHLKFHQARIGHLMSVWWMFDHRQLEVIKPLGTMHNLTIALFETLIELSRGPHDDGEPAKCWVSLSVPDKSSGTLVPRMLT